MGVSSFSLGSPPGVADLALVAAFALNGLVGLFTAVLYAGSGRCSQKLAGGHDLTLVEILGGNVPTTVGWWVESHKYTSSGHKPMTAGKNDLWEKLQGMGVAIMFALGIMAVAALAIGVGELGASILHDDAMDTALTLLGVGVLTGLLALGIHYLIEQ